MEKNETLEEAAEKYCEKIWGCYKDDVFKHNDIITDNTLSEISKKDFITGAKWQQERMYSKEEVLKIITEFKYYLAFGDEVNESQWFEPFKKKQ